MKLKDAKSSPKVKKSRHQQQRQYVNSRFWWLERDWWALSCLLKQAWRPRIINPATRMVSSGADVLTTASSLPSNRAHLARLTCRFPAPGAEFSHSLGRRFFAPYWRCAAESMDVPSHYASANASGWWIEEESRGRRAIRREQWRVEKKKAHVFFLA